MFGSEEGTILNNPTLKPGRQSFAFSYNLPSVLPHSFDAGSVIGAVAHIRYTTRAKIDLHFGADVDSDVVEFLVEGLFDVNNAKGKCLSFFLCLFLFLFFSLFRSLFLFLFFSFSLSFFLSF